MALAPKKTLVIGAALAGVLVLYVMGSESRKEGTGEPAANTTQCRVTVTADALNVRAAPDANAQRVGRYTRGTQVDADKVVQNGFRKVGENRWVAADFIQPLPGRDCG